MNFENRFINKAVPTRTDRQTDGQLSLHLVNATQGPLTSLQGTNFNHVASKGVVVSEGLDKS